MPVIHLEYDNLKVSDKEVEALSKAVRDIVSQVTKIEDVFVYANTAKIKVQIAPVEIFVQMTAKKIKNQDELIAEIKNKIIEWKSESGFKTPINLTLIPMEWKIEIGI
jgi:GTPase